MNENGVKWMSISPRFDSSGDGKLSFHEFVAALAIMIRGTEDRNKLLVSRVGFTN